MQANITCARALGRRYMIRHGACMAITCFDVERACCIVPGPLSRGTVSLLGPESMLC